MMVHQRSKHLLALAALHILQHVEVLLQTIGQGFSLIDGQFRVFGSSLHRRLSHLQMRAIVQLCL